MVKTKQFCDTRDVGSPTSSVRVHNAQGADELIFLNISSDQNKDKYLELIRSAAEEAFMPFTAGGGVRTMYDIHALLESGADKVSLNTASLETPDLIYEASRTFGKNCIVVSIDVKIFDGKYEVVTLGGQRRSGLNPVEHAKRVEALGAGEILLSSVDLDGMMTGYDLKLLECVSKAVQINVIANSGVGTLEHFSDAIDQAGISALAASSIYHFTDQHVIKVKSFLKNKGYDVRI